MDSHTKESSIRLLKQLRDVYQGQLDTSVIEEIEAVISALEQEPTCSKSASVMYWSSRVLELIGKVLQVVTNITELMN